jgi:hypothetical protein
MRAEASRSASNFRTPAPSKVAPNQKRKLSLLSRPYPLSPARRNSPSQWKSSSPPRTYGIKGSYWKAGTVSVFGRARPSTERVCGSWRRSGTLQHASKAEQSPFSLLGPGIASLPCTRKSRAGRLAMTHLGQRHLGAMAGVVQERTVSQASPCSPWLILFGFALGIVVFVVLVVMRFLLSAKGFPPKRPWQPPSLQAHGIPLALWIGTKCRTYSCCLDPCGSTRTTLSTPFL